MLGLRLSVKNDSGTQPGEFGSAGASPSQGEASPGPPSTSSGTMSRRHFAEWISHTEWRNERKTYAASRIGVGEGGAEQECSGYACR